MISLKSLHDCGSFTFGHQINQSSISGIRRLDPNVRNYVSISRFVSVPPFFCLVLNSVILGVSIIAAIKAVAFPLFIMEDFVFPFSEFFQLDRFTR